VEELYTFMAYNIREPLSVGDLAAQFGAASLLENAFRVVHEIRMTPKARLRGVFNYNGKAAFPELDEIEDGEWEFDDYGDQMS
jgi:hypothetical protein